MDRLGEALLKPIFTPTKDGVSAVTAAVDGLTRYVKEHGHEIVNFFSGAAKAAVVMAQMIAMQVSATANIIATLIGVVSSGIDQVAGVIDAVTAPLRYIPDALLPDWARAFKKYGGRSLTVCTGPRSAATTWLTVPATCHVRQRISRGTPYPV